MRIMHKLKSALGAHYFALHYGHDMHGRRESAAMTEMVERVAEAIMARIGDGGQMTGRDLALAAIEALREPTTAMLDCGVAFALQVSIGGDYRWTDYVGDKHRAMIDAALGIKTDLGRAGANLR